MLRDTMTNRLSIPPTSKKGSCTSTNSFSCFSDMFHTLLFRCYNILKRTLKTCFCCWSRCCKIANTLVGKLASISKTVIKRLHNPLCCQQILLLSHIKNKWVLSSPKSTHTAQLSVHWTPFDCNRILVGKQLWQALHRKFLTFGGNFKLQIQFKLPGTRDGIKPQVHDLTEVVIKEYRSDRELFNSINFSWWLEENQVAKLGFSNGWKGI